MGTLTVFWYVIIGGIAIAMGILWFILEKKIKEEDIDSRVEPDLNDLFDDYMDEKIDGRKSVETKKSASLHHQFKDDEALVSLMEDEDFEQLHDIPAIGDQLSLDGLTEKDLKSFSFDSVENHSTTSSQSTNQSFKQPEIRETFGDYTQLTSDQISFEDELKESREAEMISYKSESRPSQKQKPIFEANRPTLLGRFKGLFGKKDHHDIAADDHLLMIDPETGDPIIRRPAVVKTIALILQAPSDQPYHLDEVLEIAEQQQLMIGDDGFLMHLTTTHYGDEPTYSIAHLLHPGSFRAKGIEEMDLPGLLFFANIPGPDPEIDTVQYLVNIAATFGSALGGTLFDDKGEMVTEASLKKLYEEVNALDRAEWDRAISEYY